ncbi:60S ribosomal protein L41 [Hepatocystis sp. ex Piliocolobus tephrosceles]|nr:60S ribosomal protein L41 [Hepatocystis sp. ex Piliocolobus tephrosceles]
MEQVVIRRQGLKCVGSGKKRELDVYKRKEEK